MREVRWERMFPDELEQAFAKRPVVYYPYGLCEPHGPQNAVGLDALKAHGILCKVAERIGGIVAPPDYWHIHELGGYAIWSHNYVGQPPRTWLTAIPPWQHFKNICYHVRMADVLGFQAALFFTGHYGPNWEDLKTLLTLLQPHVGTRLYGLPEFESNVKGFYGDGKSIGDHAGKVETSLLWALEPDCVDMSRLPAPDAPPPHFAMGITAPESNRLAGERMVADQIDWFENRVAELLADYEAIQPNHTLQTFEDVERVWESVVRPELPHFKTMQDSWNEDAVPPNSKWFANWRVPKRDNL